MRTYRYRSLNKLANVIKVTYGVCVAFILFLIYGLLRHSSLVERYVNVQEEFGEAVLLREMDNLETTMAAALGTLALVSVVSSIIFLRWTYVAAMNAQASTTVELSNSPGWCVGWYFVPIANLWKPYTALKEIWDISDVRHRSATILGFWWFLRIATGLLARFDNGIADASLVNGPEDLYFLNNISLVVNGMTIALYVLNGVIVHRLSQMQEEKHRLGTDHGGVRECPTCGEPLDSTAVTCPVCGVARPDHRPTTDWSPSFEHVRADPDVVDLSDVDVRDEDVRDEDDELPTFENLPGGSSPQPRRGGI